MRRPKPKSVYAREKYKYFRSCKRRSAFAESITITAAAAMPRKLRIASRRKNQTGP